MIDHSRFRIIEVKQVVVQQVHPGLAFGSNLSGVHMAVNDVVVISVVRNEVVVVI